MTKTKKKRGPGGRRPRAEDVERMRLDGYGTIAAAAKHVRRAASTVYNRVNQALAGGGEIPSRVEGKKAVVKDAAGNVWVHLESLRAFLDPSEIAKAES